MSCRTLSSVTPCARHYLGRPAHHHHHFKENQKGGSWVGVCFTLQVSGTTQATHTSAKVFNAQGAP